MSQPRLLLLLREQFMVFTRSPMKRTFAALALATCFVTSLPTLTSAQGGLTIFSGVSRENQLRGWPQGGKSGNWDRYNLEIPARKMKLAVAQISISYPDYYDGTFDTRDIEITVRDRVIPIREVIWDKENYFVEIVLEEPIPAGNSVKIVFSNVKNPDFGGTYYFNCRIQSPGDVPLLRYLGTWILTIT